MKNLYSYLYCLCLICCSATILKAQHVGIIPQPQQVNILTDSLVISNQLDISTVESVSVSSIQYFRNQLMDRFGIYTTVNTTKNSVITFKYEKSDKNSTESYRLNIQSNKIEIISGSDQGFFNGINSLVQLIAYHQPKSGKIALPHIQINDEPAFGWRGFMFDESRHFFGTKKVKQLLDWMALYKLNKFHWHLTDEPAWRIEIKQYPFLTLVGGVGTYTDPLVPAQYYTQEEIKEIVLYAAARHIEVIPEIDMPGHATAANRAYPQFSGGGTKDHPDFTFHPAKEGTYQYLTRILKEVNVLFPSALLHLGGDEVAFGSEAWNSDKDIQNLKTRLDYTTNKEVETYFMRRMADSVYHMGAKLLVWDEMADAGLPKDKTIMFWWRHDKMSQLDLSLKNGYATVVCPRIPFYFDFVQEEAHQYGRKWGKAFNPLEVVYDFNVEELKSKEQYPNQILGVQANLWTERVHNVERFDFMVFPRIAALAETAWTKQERKDYTAFSNVLKKHLNLYRAEKIYFYDPFNHSQAEPKVQITTKKYIDNFED